MCNTNQSALMSYGLKVPNPAIQYGLQLPSQQGPGQGISMLDLHRAQLYDYTTRLQYAVGIRGYHPGAVGFHPYHSPTNLALFYAKHDPRARFVHEEPKPSHSYIGLIAMAILSIPEKKLVLSDIYQWILDNYSYFRARGPGWRNSIRHNLSLNDCFIKSGRSANGKGHYWAIHPANLEDFKKGDFRRRRAQRRVRKHMGLAVPDDEDDDSPCPSPGLEWQRQMINMAGSPILSSPESANTSSQQSTNSEVISPSAVKKRTFDMASLLAPDTTEKKVFETSVNNPTKSLAIVGNTEKKDTNSEKETEASILREGEVPATVASTNHHQSPSWPNRFNAFYPSNGTVWNPVSPGNPHSIIVPIPIPIASSGSQSIVHDSPEKSLVAATPATVTVAPDTSAEKWNETFSKIMARSYDKTAKNVQSQ